MWKHHQEELEDRDTVEHNVCIVPGSFCAMRCTNNGKYLPEHMTSGLDHEMNIFKRNLESYQTVVC